MICSARLSVTLSAVLWFGSAPALAAMPGVSATSQWENPNGAALYVLENASAAALERAQMNKGARKCWCLMKNVELKDLIRRLEQGERVTLEEIRDAIDGLLNPNSAYAG